MKKCILAMLSAITLVSSAATFAGAAPAPTAEPVTPPVAQQQQQQTPVAKETTTDKATAEAPATDKTPEVVVAPVETAKAAENKQTAAK